MKKSILQTMTITLALLTAASVWAQYDRTSERIKRLANRVNNELQTNAQNLSDDDQRAVLELLRALKDRLRLDNGNDNGNGGGGVQLVDSQVTSFVSRKTGGQWITVQLPQSSVLSQVNIRSIGSSKVRVYNLVAVTVQNQQLQLQMNTSDLQNGSVGSAIVPTNMRISYLQILAEAWSSDMRLGVDSLGSTNDNGTQPPPYQPPGNGNPPPYNPPSNGNYACMAACKFSNSNNGDLRYVGFGSSAFQTEAQNNALSHLRAGYSCGNGSVIVECSQEQQGVDFQAYASCSNTNGKPDLRYISSLATEKSLTQAKYSALVKLRAGYSCGETATVVKSAPKYQKLSYCVAACTDANGNADLNYTKGKKADSRLEAEVGALQLLRASYSCSNTAIVYSCE